MFDMNNKLMNRFFRPVPDAVWDLMSGKVGIKTREGIVTIEGEGDDAQPVVNVIDDFGVAIPAFAQNTPVAAVQPGDLLMGTKEPIGWVLEKKEKSFKILKADGTRTNWVVPKIAMFGFDSGVMVLRSLLSMLPGGTTALTGMQNSLLPLMMLGDGEINFEKMMPVLLFSQMNGGDPAAGGNNMLQMMLMMQMLGGKKFGSSSSSGNIFDRGGR